MAQRVVKAAQSPTSTADFPAMIITTILPMLSPASAAARLLALAHSIDMSGIHTVTLPYIGKSGRPVPLFIAEGAPIPFAELTAHVVTLGPAKRVEVLTGLTNEMLQATGDTAATLFGDALDIAVKQSLETKMLSNVAGDAIAPAGLLYGLTPIASSGTGGLEGMADDAGVLAKTIGADGINTASMIIVTTSELAEKALVLRLIQSFPIGCLHRPCLPTARCSASRSKVSRLVSAARRRLKFRKVDRYTSKTQTRPTSQRRARLRLLPSR